MVAQSSVACGMPADDAQTQQETNHDKHDNVPDRCRPYQADFAPAFEF
jgi:hypothetical protein